MLRHVAYPLLMGQSQNALKSVLSKTMVDRVFVFNRQMLLQEIILYRTQNSP